MVWVYAWSIGSPSGAGPMVWVCAWSIGSVSGAGPMVWPDEFVQMVAYPHFSHTPTIRCGSRYNHSGLPRTDAPVLPQCIVPDRIVVSSPPHLVCDLQCWPHCSMAAFLYWPNWGIFRLKPFGLHHLGTSLYIRQGFVDNCLCWNYNWSFAESIRRSRTGLRHDHRWESISSCLEVRLSTWALYSAYNFARISGHPFRYCSFFCC